MSTEQIAGKPVRSRPIRALERLMNPLMRTVLRSPVLKVVSGSMLVIRFNGRRSGKRYELVVGYREHDGVVEIVSPGNWWKNLQGEDAIVDVMFRGSSRRGRAEVHYGDPTVLDVYRRLMADSSSVVRLYGVSRNADGSVNDESLRAAVSNCAVVLVSLVPV